MLTDIDPILLVVLAAVGAVGAVALIIWTGDDK